MCFVISTVLYSLAEGELGKLWGTAGNRTLHYKLKTLSKGSAVTASEVSTFMARSFNLKVGLLSATSLPFH
jgi:hypothetical protein